MAGAEGEGEREEVDEEVDWRRASVRGSSKGEVSFISALGEAERVADHGEASGSELWATITAGSVKYGLIKYISTTVSCGFGEWLTGREDHEDNQTHGSHEGHEGTEFGWRPAECLLRVQCFHLLYAHHARRDGMHDRHDEEVVVDPSGLVALGDEDLQWLEEGKCVADTSTSDSCCLSSRAVFSHWSGDTAEPTVTGDWLVVAFMFPLSISCIAFPRCVTGGIRSLLQVEPGLRGKRLGKCKAQQRREYGVDSDSDVERR